MPNPPTIATLRGRTPILIPDFDQPFLHNRNVTGLSAISTLDSDDNISEIQAENVYGTILSASATVTIGGTTVANDTVTLRVLPCSATAPVGKGLSLTVIVGSSPTTTTVATQLALAINANPAFAAILKATSAAAVVTVTAVRGGLLGNSIAIATAVTGTTTATASAANLSGGTGNIATPLEAMVIQQGKSTYALYPLRPIVLTPALLAALQTSQLFVI